MKIILVLLVVVLVYYCSVCYSATCDLKTPGTVSNVLCVSKTEFKFDKDDPEADALPCPPGMVCADVPEICSEAEVSVCKNTVIGSQGTCNECRDSAPSKVCISETEYSVCTNGNLISILKYSCGIDKPYCKAVIDPQTNKLTSICQAEKENIDCLGVFETTTPSPTTPTTTPETTTITTTPTTTPTTSSTESTTTTASTTTTTTTTPSTPGEVTCTAEGLFPDPSDTTCLRYYKCTKNQSGSFSVAKFQCLSAQYAFNPITQRCDVAANVNCNAS